MIYSPMDAVQIALAEPTREVVFFAIGFETTTPATALSIACAARKKLKNFTVFCNHVLTPPAIRAILDTAERPEAERVALDGFIGPAHVSAVIGTDPYLSLAADYQKPVVVAGFEPLDVIQAILMLVRQVNEGRFAVENQYTRAATAAGNTIAKGAIADVFELRESFEWRGLGELAASALRLRGVYAEFDAERRFAVVPATVADNPACECGEVLRGLVKPAECKLFGTVCTPDRPIGSCMVSPEGACAAHWTYGRFRDRTRISAARAAA
jgi:hydrogenase expression/formation protein HypD